MRVGEVCAAPRTGDDDVALVELPLGLIAPMPAPLGDVLRTDGARELGSDVYDSERCEAKMEGSVRYGSDEISFCMR